MLILVAGSAGFIGSHMCERLLQHGHHVVGIDNTRDDLYDTVSMLKRTYPRYTHIQSNVDDSTWTRHSSVLLPWHFDTVFHFASSFDPIAFRSAPLDLIHANTIGTEVLLEFAKYHQARFFYASTPMQYLDPSDPITIAVHAKHMGEAITTVYKRANTVQTRIGRIYDTYGPRMLMTRYRELPRFIDNLFLNKPIQISNNPSEVRSWCYIDDVVTGILTLMDHDTVTIADIGQPILVDLTTIAGTLKTLHPKWTSQVEFIDGISTPSTIIPRLSPLLDWMPNTPLTDGLQKTILWYTKYYTPNILQLTPEQLLSITNSTLNFTGHPKLT